jgi:alpha-D-xyloside xylohydrolase
MAETIRGGLSLTSSGFAFWSHDIGGFEGTPPEAIYCRWVALGLWSSHVSHARHPDTRNADVLSPDFTDLARTGYPGSTEMMPSGRPPRWSRQSSGSCHTSLLRSVALSLYRPSDGQAIKATETGLPVMRSMVLEFPEDPTCTMLDKQ